MHLLDEIHLTRPFYGSRRLRDELEDQGHRVNRKRVQRLMRQMGLRALYPKHRTSPRGDGHKIYPYLLTGLSIERPNQVWASDICYIPMATGFMYLVAIMDWYSRRVLAWRVSNTLDSDFCVEALEDALTCDGTPEIFNTDPKVLSSRPKRLRRCSKPMRWPSAWTVRAGGSTTCSSSASGAASSTRMCIYMRTRHPPHSEQGSPAIFTSTMADGGIVHLAGVRRMWCTSTQPTSARRPETRWRFH